MKKIILLFIIVSLLSGFVNALPISTGLSVGSNMNSTQGNYALSSSVFCDYKITDFINVGLQLAGSYDFIASYVISPSAYMMLNIGSVEVNSINIMPYMKIDMGVSIITQNNVMSPFFLSSVTGALRLYFNKFYLDPYVSLGFPFNWGFGLGVGYSF